ncbi:hypothetical protein F5B20DRAFT_121463 [Whalleya microplaca]|nr:hypothetical protein F5B20DRAFT_121463 [Whalleya microplaca]
MKFRGILGSKAGSQVPVVDETAARTTGVDAEAARAKPNVISETTAEPGSPNHQDGSFNEKDIEVPTPTEELQYGVQLAEATLKVWTRNHLIAAYVLMWLVNFVQAFASGCSSTFTVYVTSSFQAHSLTATTSILATLMAGLIKLPYAKVLDIFGRPQGFILAVCSITMGLIMMAACQNVYTYCAAQVFYQMGYNCIDFTVSIFIADTSQLKNRAFMFAYASTPWLITVWAYGPACERMLDTFGYRWGFGIWAIVVPVVCSPLAALFLYNARKAEKMGLVHVTPHGRGVVDNLLHYAVEFDVIGLLTLATGLALFLLSFSLYANQADTWRSPLIICFLIFGGLLVIAFGFWERYLAPKTFIPWWILKNRTVFFTYTMVASLYLPWYIWDSYFYSLNIVLFNQSVTNATYIGNIYTVGSCVWSLVVGVVIHYYGRLRPLATYFGVPMTILGVALMIHFRQPDVNIGFIVMCQIFVAFGGGTLVICEQMTVMAVSKHENIPAVLAVEGLVANVGGAIGLSIASAMWQGIFPVKLAEYLPAEAQADFANIYGDITVQSSYPIGSPTRNAINQSYGDTQKLMLIAATCLYAITWASTFMWENINVKKIKQFEGVMW